jgi:hypothetical protein
MQKVFDFSPKIHINGDAHVFIATNGSRETSLAYQTTVYSILSQTDKKVSIIPLDEKYRWLITKFCREKDLGGQAVYLKEGFVFKQPFDLLLEEANESKPLWYAPILYTPNKSSFLSTDYHQELVVYNLEFGCLDRWFRADPAEIVEWSMNSYTRFNFVEVTLRPRTKHEANTMLKKYEIRDLELGKLDSHWNIIPTIYEEIESYDKIKGFNFSHLKPWLNTKNRFAKEWWKELNLYNTNSLKKEILFNISKL